MDEWGDEFTVKDTGEDVEVGTTEGLETVQVAENSPGDFLKTEENRKQDRVQEMTM